MEMYEEWEGGMLFIYFISKASSKVALTLLGLEGRSCWALLDHPSSLSPRVCPEEPWRNLPSVSTPKLLILKPPFKHCPDGLHSHHNLTGLPHRTRSFPAQQLPQAWPRRRELHDVRRPWLITATVRFSLVTPSVWSVCLSTHTRARAQKKGQVRARAARAERESLHAPCTCLSPRLPPPRLVRTGLWLLSPHIQTAPPPQTPALLTQWQLAAEVRLLIKLLACKTGGELVENPCPVPLRERSLLWQLLEILATFPFQICSGLTGPQGAGGG